MAKLAAFVGIFVVALCALGLVAPGPFVRLVGSMQDPPLIYLAAALRLTAGLILLRAARSARTPRILAALGAVIALGGALTPFFGVWGGHIILMHWTTAGPNLVRLWAAAGLALGVFIVFTITSRPRTT